MSQHPEQEEDLPPLAELEEDQQTPSARQRAQRRLPLAYRKAWSNVITGQVLEIVAQERGEAPPPRRHADGRPRGMAALIPEAPRPITRDDLPWPPGGTVFPSDQLGQLAEQVLADAPRDLVAPPPTGLSILQAVTTPRTVLPLPERPDDGPLAAALARLRPAPGAKPRPPGDASAGERLAHPDTGWCTFDALPGQHLLDVALLDVHQLDHAQRHLEVVAPSGAVLLTLCGQISPRAAMHTAPTPPQRCPDCTAAASRRPAR